MFKRTKRKIIILIMAASVLLIIGTLGIIYAASYAEVYQKNKEMLIRYADGYFASGGIKGQEMPESLPQKDGEDNLRKPADLEQPDEKSNDAFQISTFFAVVFSEAGEVEDIDNDGNTSRTDEELVQMAETVSKIGKTQGVYGKFVYLVREHEGLRLVVFMDNTLISDSITTLFRNTIIFGGCAVVVLFILSVYFSGWIVRPLEEKDQKQKQFISDAGHELKTPVSVMNANLEILKREIGENKWLANIQFENSRMGDLIEQMLELSRAENVSLEKAEVDLGRIVMGGVLPFESLVFEQGIEIEYDIEENVKIIGDQMKIGQLVSILTDNAVTYSESGGRIIVKVKRGTHTAEISVSNTGAEIPAEQRTEIFERFYRIDKARNGEGRHYGLGLAIARAVVEAHNGTILVSSEGGITTFTTIFPLKGRVQ